MGARHSTQQVNLAAAPPSDPDSNHPPPQPSLHDIKPTPLLPEPKWFGYPSEAIRAANQVLPSEAAAIVWSSVPPPLDASDANSRLHPEGWGLLYHSKIHGCSFSRMVQLITDKGPTVIVMRTASPGDDPSLRRVFGGYNETSWLTVSQRERLARSNAAAIARARRDGVSNGAGVRPSNQSPTFFGNERSFLFSISNAAGSDGAAAATVYRSRPNVNSNFMYLFDVHPDDERVGIGMGGQSPGQFGWFLDRWLEGGVCRGVRCSTYHNPMLSATESWHVESVEVYALGWATVQDIWTVGGTSADGHVPTTDTGCSVRKGADVMPDKIILELAQAHHFYADHDPRCDEDDESAQECKCSV